MLENQRVVILQLNVLHENYLSKGPQRHLATAENLLPKNFFSVLLLDKNSYH